MQESGSARIGECGSLIRDDDHYGQWRYWCFVDSDEDCDDSKNGLSFEACTGGKSCISTTLD